MNWYWVQWLFLVLWVPISITLGIVASVLLSGVSEVWEEYIGAVILPVVGLTGALWVAPSHKAHACTAMYFVGLGIAYFFFTPSFYPEHHPQAYQATYVPFVMTWGVGLLYLVVLLAIIRKSALTSHSTGRAATTPRAG